MTAPEKFATTPEPPYYVVVFTSRLRDGSDGYEQMATAMEELVVTQPGYLGHESARSADGFGITVSYWRDEGSVTRWKDVAAHRVAQSRGQSDWYRHYEVRVAKVERAYARPHRQAAVAKGELKSA